MAGLEWIEDVFVHSRASIFQKDPVLNATAIAQVSSGEEGVDDVEAAEWNKDVFVHSKMSISEKSLVLMQLQWRRSAVGRMGSMINRSICL